MKLLKKIFSMINLSVAGLAMLFLIIGSTALHIYTIYVGFQFAGFWPALITFFVVGVSEIFWGYIFWQATGVFLNTYNIILLGYVVLSFISVIIVANYFAQKNNVPEKDDFIKDEKEEEAYDPMANKEFRREVKKMTSPAGKRRHKKQMKEVKELIAKVKKEKNQ